MKYIMVLQWPSSSLHSYDLMIETENMLIAALPKGNEIDGHDVGSGEANIFINTDDPERLYQKLRGLLMEHGAWSDARIAYRRTDGDDYTVLWPKDLRAFEVR